MDRRKHPALPSPQLLGDVWREACRHLSLPEALVAIEARLRDALPVGRFFVLDLDLVRQVLVALPPERAHLPEGSAPSATAFRRLRAWAESGECTDIGDLREDSPSLLRMLPADLAAATLLCGLTGAHGARGLLVVEPRSGATFGPEQVRFVHMLRDPLSAALDNHHQLRELDSLRASAEADRLSLLARLGRDTMNDTVIGVTEGLRGVFERLVKVCTSDLPVLILGETGAGKEVVAREIHTRSPRADAPFIRVNCGAIPPELIDSELFGHEKGSFTGATNQRLGWFERAHAGTLFLDEVGELPLAAQVRLLRVLQDGIIQRVGGAGEVAVDVRIVAATHRDLPRLIQEGRFREDLWYRLATFPIILPPLRERRSDIPALAAHFARRAASRFGLRLQLPTPEDLVLLTAYDWPGNVRELAAVMDRATILGEGEQLEIAVALGSPREVPALAASACDGAGQAQLTSRDQSNPPITLDQAMRQHIESVLAVTQGRIEGRHGAARLLAINPHTLRARMRKLGIAWRSYRVTQD